MRAGDHDPLALAAGQLVRIAECELGGGPQPGGFERGQDARLEIGVRRWRGG